MLVYLLEYKLVSAYLKQSQTELELEKQELFHNLDNQDLTNHILLEVL